MQDISYKYTVRISNLTVPSVTSLASHEEHQTDRPPEEFITPVDHGEHGSSNSGWENIW
jgi:hypothetical protein